jgi:hypothetical protein
VVRKPSNPILQLYQKESIYIMPGMKESLGIKSGNGEQGIRRVRRSDGKLGAPTNAFLPGQVANPEGGRKQPKVMNENIRLQLLEGLKLGLPYAKIAALMGVRVGTMRNWMNYAEQQFIPWYRKWERSNFDEPDELPFWIQLYVDIKEAIAEGEQRCLAVIRDAAVGQQQTTEFTVSRDSKQNVVYEKEVTKTHKSDWRPAAWLLERRFPERYGRKRADGDEIPKGLDYETIMLAKVLKTIPRSDLEEIKQLVRQKMRPELPGNDGDNGSFADETE